MQSNLEHHVIDSQAIGSEYRFSILTAASTHRLKECYLLLVHDGYDYLKLGHLQKIFVTFTPQEVQKLLFVLLPPGDSQQRWHYYHALGKDQLHYLHFIYDELLPYLKAFTRERGLKVVKRGMIGDSLAGAASYRIALKKPRKWTHILLQSAAFCKEDLVMMHEDGKTLPWIVYQCVGTKEDQFISPLTNERLYIYSRNQTAKKYFKRSATQFFYKEKEEAHLWAFWRKDLPAAIHIFIHF